MSTKRSERPNMTTAPSAEGGGAGDAPPDAGATDPSTTGDREQRIREAAYARYQARGGEKGHHVQDWLDAEAEMGAVKGPPDEQ